MMITSEIGPDEGEDWLFITQTYDASPSYDAELEPESFHYPSEGRFTNRGLRRSHSFAATNSRFGDSQTMQRSISRQSFSSELQVINNKVNVSLNFHLCNQFNQDFESFKFENFMNQRRFEQSSNTSASVHLTNLLRVIINECFMALKNYL